jgi:hypothetical protein
MEQSQAQIHAVQVFKATAEAFHRIAEMTAILGELITGAPFQMRAPTHFVLRPM